MQRKTKPDSSEVDQIIESAPPVHPLIAIRNSLLYAMFKGVNEEDMTTIVAAQVAKARLGDTKSARFVVDMILPHVEPVTNTHTREAILLCEHSNEGRSIEEIRCDIARWLLRTDEPQGADEIINFLNLPGVVVMQALEGSKWFQRKPKGWVATSLAREAVLNVK